MSTNSAARWIEVTLSYYAIVVFAVLWLGFIIALLANTEWLDDAWQWILDLPLALQAIVWILFLPITVGLWLWQADWATAMKLLGGAALIGWTGVAISSIVRVWRG